LLVALQEFLNSMFQMAQKYLERKLAMIVVQ